MSSFENTPNADSASPADQTPNSASLQTSTGKHLLPEAAAKTSADLIWTVVTAPGLTLAQGQMYLLPLNEFAFAPPGTSSYTQTQVESMRHVYSGPDDNLTSFHVQVGSAPNAMVNGRLLISHIPPIYTQDEILKMTPDILSQFPSKFHVLRGPNTVFETKWCKTVPWMLAYDKTDYNGTIAICWSELNLESKSEASLVIWVSQANQKYSFPCAIKPFVKPSLLTDRRKFPQNNAIPKAKAELQHIIEVLSDNPEITLSNICKRLDFIHSLL